MCLMSPGTTLLCVFSILVALCGGLNLEDAGFDFVQNEYARALTEYHAVNKTVMHIRAAGCGKQPVTYTITEPDTPFRIDEKGHIWLDKPLNSEKVKSYVLHVKAVCGNGEKKVANAVVHFNVINMNKHAPQFEFEKYSCDVVENTREMRFNPILRVLDADRGEAGRIKNVTIVESGLPFVFTVNENGVVTGKATKDMDAEDITNYFFDIIAWDNGHPSKSSFPVSLECEVDDVNEFPPQFMKDSYQATIQRGRTYDSILQILAEDKDIGLVSGRVCKYIVEGFNLPFKVSEQGVVSLDKPLGPEAYDMYDFQVDAVDCSGMMSLKSAKISITVKTPCHAEFVGPAKHERTLHQCTGKVMVTPDIKLNDCVRKEKNANFSALVYMETPSGMGCDRETFEASDIYTLCGASDFIDLLPRPGTGREWTKMLKVFTKKWGRKEKNGYFFDGKTYVEVPNNAVPEDIGDKFTISTWVKMGLSKGRQTIVANTDKERLDRVHFSLSVSGSKLFFVHRREAIHASRNLYCNAEFQYKPVIFDFKWHHIVVVADGCAAKLFIDGVHQPSVVVTPDWTLHKSKLRNRLTVGARYLAKEAVYSEYFTGYLSGLAIKPNTTLDEQILHCVVGCKEHVKVEGPLPGKFSAETIDFATIRIFGMGAPDDFVKALQHIVYINERLVPTPGKRSVMIMATFNATPLQTVNVDINVAGNTRPVIVVQGLDADIGLNWMKRNVLREKGQRIFETLEITYEGCEKEEDSPVDKARLLDMALVRVDPPFKKEESFNFPHGIKGLKEKGLSVSFNKQELVIRGIAHFSEYEDVLRQMVYINLDPASNLHREFTVMVSTLKGKCVSDKERLNLNTIYSNRGLGKYDVKYAKSSLKEEQMAGVVSMEGGFAGVTSNSISAGIMALIIVCSLSIFILLVVIGIYKFRQKPETVKVAAPGDDKEEMYWDDTGLSGVRITLNPMQKFQELDLNEDGANTDKSDTEDEEGGAAKGLLEWDNSDM